MVELQDFVEKCWSFDDSAVWPEDQEAPREWISWF